MSPAYNLFVGTFIHLPRRYDSSDEKHILDIHHGALWVSTTDGCIKGFDWGAMNDADLDILLKRKGWVLDNGRQPKNAVTVKIIRARVDKNEFFFPGFIDTHIHAPQYPNAGVFGSSTLLDWLETYTFPLESSFGDSSKASSVYNQVISRTLSNGTTFASYFATIHVPATNLLATLCQRRGQRALIGRVCMDNPTFCPDYYRDSSSDDSIAATQATINHIHSIDPSGTIVKPIITPRFAPTCSPAALKGLGKLAASYNPPLHIQTHISENTNEVSLVQELFPTSKNYADIYDQTNLLTPRTILAHAVHLTTDERNLIAARNAKVSHCPASNSALGSGLCPVRRLLDSGITVGLGTDVSGGYSPSILEAVRQACLVSRLLRHSSAGDDDLDLGGKETLSVEEGLYLATRGGAAVVDMTDEIGGFDVGMFWDAQMVRLGRVGGSAPDAAVQTEGSPSADGIVDIFGWESWPEKIHKWVWTGDDRNVRAVWVHGRLVHSLEDSISEGKTLIKSGAVWKWTWLWGLGLAGAWFIFDRATR